MAFTYLRLTKINMCCHSRGDLALVSYSSATKVCTRRCSSVLRWVHFCVGSMFAGEGSSPRRRACGSVLCGMERLCLLQVRRNLTGKPELVQAGSAQLPSTLPRPTGEMCVCKLALLGFRKDFLRTGVLKMILWEGSCMVWRQL